MFKLNQSKIQILSVIFIFLFGFSLRLFNLNWDQNQHLHPDERFLTMVVSDIKLPQNLTSYFDTNNSTFNPENNNYDFYAYGTFPLLITKIIGNQFSLENQYDFIFLIGRIISSIFDASIIFLIFGICKNLKLKFKTIFFATIFYSITILPIQLSHFFTVDSFTVFFSTLTVFIFLKYLSSQNYKYIILSGFFFGLTMANKTSIGITLPLFLLFIIFIYFKNKQIKILERIKLISLSEILFLFSSFISFRIFQPYAFNGLIKISPNFLNSINLANKMINGSYDYPPNIQWVHTIPIIHPLINIFFFGLGPVMTILSFLGIYLFFRKNKSNLNFIFLIYFSSLIFFYFSFQLAKYMRYFYPIYPFLIIFSAIAFSNFDKFLKTRIIILILIFINTFLFLNIYTQTNSRLTADKWICQNIPQNSTIGSEFWDDSLPLVTDPNCNFFQYKSISLPFFDKDSEDKWQKINQQLEKVDYLIMSSNRLWGSIPKDSQRYPTTAKFYQDLFNQKLSFQEIKTIYSYPKIPLPFLKKCFILGLTNYPSGPNHFIKIDNDCPSGGIYFRDDLAEESFTVYDHPQVIIFKKTR